MLRGNTHLLRDQRRLAGPANKGGQFDLLHRAGLAGVVAEAPPVGDVVDLLVWLGNREIANDAARAAG